LFVVVWSDQWKDHFRLIRERIKVVMSAFGRRAGGEDTRVTGGCFGGDIDTVIAWDTLMTRDPNEGDIVIDFLECGYERLNTCRERVAGVRVGNV